MLRLFNNKGITMPMVMAILAIVIIFSVTAFILAENQTIAVTNTDSREDALHIAEAGYNNYLWHLNDDSLFYRTGVDADAGLVPSTYYMASPWESFPEKYAVTTYKNGSVILGYYQLKIIPPNVGQPVVTIQSTGWTPNDPGRKRTIEVSIFKREFTNYADFSGDMTGPNGTVAWGSGEVANGPVYTNGTLRVNGNTVFKSTVTYVTGKDINGSPTFLPGQPTQGTALTFPPGNKSINKWGDPGNGGYTYVGRTCILIDGDMLYIKNKSNGDRLESMKLPASGVVYVKNGDVYISGRLDGRLTVSAFKEPAYTGEAGNIYITGLNPTNFDIGSNGLFHSAYNSLSAAEKSRVGLTYANTNIPSISNPQTAGSSNDMLGLVANRNILVNTSRWPASNINGYITIYGGDVAVPDINIQAAVFAYGDSSFYGVDNYSGIIAHSLIKLVGSKIATRVGATYTTSDFGTDYLGYKENNTFDTRMKYDMPPHFLEPENSGWEVKNWKEIANP